jgi:hypothetical protein
MRLELNGEIWVKTVHLKVKCNTLNVGKEYILWSTGSEKLPELMQQMNTKSSYFQFHLSI